MTLQCHAVTSAILVYSWIIHELLILPYPNSAVTVEYWYIRR